MSKTPHTVLMPLRNYWVQRDTTNNGVQFLERIKEPEANRLRGLGYKVRRALDQTPKFVREFYGKGAKKSIPIPIPMFDLEKYDEEV